MSVAAFTGCCCCCWVPSVVSDSVRPHRRQPTRLCCPWDSPAKNTGMGCHSLLQCMKVKNESEVAQSWPTLCDPMDCSLPGSSIHGIFQARVLEWVAIAFSESRYSDRYSDIYLNLHLSTDIWCWALFRMLTCPLYIFFVEVSRVFAHFKIELLLNVLEYKL